MELLKIATQIARKGGDYLLTNFRRDPDLLSKRGLSKEVSTKYDKECDRILIDEITRRYPDHNLLTEESGKIERKGQYTWIIDSLDGTGNFAAGNPFFSVSIGIMKGDELIAGVVYAPYLEELYAAQKGNGCTLNGKQVKVSEVSSLDQAYIVACEGGSKDNNSMTELFRNIYPKVKDMRKIGSAAIECGLVASGRADGYTTLSIHPWDVAAGVLLVKEAGGQVTDFKGKPWQPAQTDLVCSNKRIHEELRDLTCN
ncbi:MAG: inositol monophosphatase family protein [Candidatus Woesearchaeota archaeon]